MNGLELRKRRQRARLGLEKFSADAGRGVKWLSRLERNDMPVSDHIAAVLEKLEAECGCTQQLDLFLED